MEGASGCTVRWLIDENDGAPTFSMRHFVICPGGHSPRHAHPYEHEVFVLEGNGVVLEGDAEHPLRAGDVVFVKPDEIHQFRNTTDKPIQFLCLIPHRGARRQTDAAPECGAT
jgi:quercetin dioxygenase-like cupin family protein